MKALELLKDYKNIDFGCNMDDLHIQIDEAIKELEEYESDMDSYLDYTTGSRCTKSFNSSLGSIKNAYDRELEKIVKENIEHELSEHKSSKNINTNRESSLFCKLFSFLIFTSIPGYNKNSLRDKIEEETLKDLVELEVLKNKKLLLSLNKENNELKKENQELLKVIKEANSLIQNILKDRKWATNLKKLKPKMELI